MSPFGKLFWGFLIVFIDIRIGGFDILIDLVGYVLIVIGLGELQHRNRLFGRARPYATVLLVLSAFDLFTRTPYGGSGVGLFGSPGLAVAFIVALLFVNVMLVFFVCRGIGEMARERGAAELADLSITRWQFFLGTQIASTVLLVIAFSGGDPTALALASMIASLVAALLIAGLLRRADKTLYPRGA